MATSFASGDTISFTLQGNQTCTFVGSGTMTVTPTGDSVWKTHIEGNQEIGPMLRRSTVSIVASSDGSYTVNNPVVLIPGIPSSGGFVQPAVAVTSAYTVSSSEGKARVDASAGAVTVTLPASPTDGEEHNIKKVDASLNAVTVSGNGHNIDGASTFKLTSQYQSVTVYYDSTTTTWNVQ